LLVLELPNLSLIVVDPGLSKAFQIPTYKVTEKNNYCRHWAANCTPADENPVIPPPQAKSSWVFGTPSDASRTKKVPKADKSNPYAGDTDGLWIYCYPNTGINCYEPAWYSMRVIPLEKNKTRLEYEIFTKKGIEEAKVQEFIAFLKEVEKEVLQSLYRTGLIFIYLSGL
jgi:hypothetical protein